MSILSGAQVAPLRGAARVRAAIRRVHLWLGLSLGALFALSGVTGSALVFYVEIDALTHRQPTVSAPAPGWASPVWDRALATGRAWQRHPGKWSLEANGTGGTVPARFYPAGEGGHHGARTMVWFSPDGEWIVRAEPWGGYPMSWLYELHMHLLSGEAGRQVVGWSGFAVLLLLVSGMVAWWPRGGWGKALAFKRDAAPIRRLHDLHKLTGLWSLSLLFVLSLTGALLALPDQRDQLLGLALKPAPDMPTPRSRSAEGAQVSLKRALAAAHRAVPDAQLKWIDVPPPGLEPLRIRIRVPGDPAVRFPQGDVFIDQHSGAVLAVHDPRRGNAASGVIAWIRPLHDASFGGTGTRVLGVVAGLTPAMLFATGLMRWRRRRLHRLRKLKGSLT